MSDKPLRVIFAGTPAFAALHLKAIINSKHQLTGVYTQPDRSAGRGRKLQASPVKQLAEDSGISVYQPTTLKDIAAQQQLADIPADVLVVVAYGLILPPAVLATPPLGCLNVHASVLPRWRGAAPIQRAIEAGDTSTGVTIMQMDAGLDTGDMLATNTCPIGPQSTAASLHDDLARLGPPLLLKVLGDLQNGRTHPQKQDNEEATYAAKIFKPEAKVDWQQSATVLDRRIRAFNPFPICFSTLGSERIRIWHARPQSSDATRRAPGTISRADEKGIVVACGENEIVIETLQLEGGKALSAQQILSAHRAKFTIGNQFDPLLPNERQ